MAHTYAFPLCVQLPLPANYQQDEDFCATMALLQELGFYGVELNITDFTQPAEELVRFLAGYGLKLSMIATGGYAGKQGLSLSSLDEAVRTRTVAEMRTIIDYAAATGAGVICGFIKGVAGMPMEEATRQMDRSLEELSQQVKESGVDVYLEATNHYEATLANRVQDGVEFSRKWGDIYRVLPDTYHMNIEEVDMAAALVRYQGYYRNLHISDNNRYFPGFGAIDFAAVLCWLKAMGYTGTMSIEGRNWGTLRDDIRASAAYMEEASKKTAFV
ncbi:MAG: sugar phosphate isomerase/epimerase family protein [Eubacteriales bacterium]|jgi:D-psicose/D-tagatose/L-ribulose 3-epimerase